MPVRPELQSSFTAKNIAFNSERSLIKVSQNEAFASLALTLRTMASTDLSGAIASVIDATDMPWKVQAGIIPDQVLFPTVCGYLTKSYSSVLQMRLFLKLLGLDHTRMQACKFCMQACGLHW